MAVCLTVGPATLAAAKLTSHDVWCLNEGNWENVIRTAELEGAGVPYDDGTTLTPSGAGQPVSLVDWRADDGPAFHRACEKTYAAFGRTVELADLSQAITDLDEPDGFKYGLPLISGAVIAALAAWLSYVFAKRGRAADRRYETASELGLNLSELMVGLDQLIAATERNTRKNEEAREVKALASALKEKMPDTATATAALGSLAGSVPSDLPELKRLRTEVNNEVGKLLRQIHKAAG